MVSPDGGPNFRPAALPPGAQALHILSTGNRLLGVLRATNGSLSLAFSDDSAATWRPVPGSAGIEYLERQGSRVFATAPGGGLRSGWAHYRVDVSATPPTLAELHFGTLSPQFGAGVEIDGVLVSPLDAGSAPPVHTVVVSRDGGVTWRPWVLGLDNPASPRVVALRLIGDSLFAVTGGPGKGVESAIYRAPLSEFRVP
jgi:hypothetical protein